MIILIIFVIISTHKCAVSFSEIYPKKGVEEQNNIPNVSPILVLEWRFMFVDKFCMHFYSEMCGQFL